MTSGTRRAHARDRACAMEATSGEKTHAARARGSPSAGCLDQPPVERGESMVEIALDGGRLSLTFDERDEAASGTCAALWITLKAVQGVELSCWKPAPGGRMERRA
jgi:hypothetical protein